MQKTIFLILLGITILAIIAIVCLSVYISLVKPRELSSTISLDNISSIKISMSVPEKFNETIEFNLSAEEVSEFITLIKSTSVARVFGDNNYDTTGYALAINYSDGTTTLVSYREYVMLNSKWYKVYGYSFDYIYETNSYKVARDLVD